QRRRKAAGAAHFLHQPHLQELRAERPRADRGRARVRPERGAHRRARARVHREGGEEGGVRRRTRRRWGNGPAEPRSGIWLAVKESSLRVMVSRKTESGLASSKHHRGTTMNHYAGIDVSLEYASVCVIDATGKIVREGKVLSEPEALL